LNNQTKLRKKATRNPNKRKETINYEEEIHIAGARWPLRRGVPDTAAKCSEQTGDGGSNSGESCPV
jgi:hypothetical protein